MLNWIFLIMIFIYGYFSDYFLKKHIVSKANISDEIDKKMLEIRNKVNKSIEEQKQYLDYASEKDSQYGNNFNRFLFIVIMTIGLTIVMDFFNNIFFLLFCSLLISFGYTYTTTRKADIYIKVYNIISMFNIFLAIILFIYINARDQLTFLGFKMNFILLFILFFALDGFIKYIKEKVYKKETKVDK